jgi:hypothetical protein
MEVAFLFCTLETNPDMSVFSVDADKTLDSLIAFNPGFWILILDAILFSGRQGSFAAATHDEHHQQHEWQTESQEII